MSEDSTCQNLLGVRKKYIRKVKINQKGGSHRFEKEDILSIQDESENRRQSYSFISQELNLERERDPMGTIGEESREFMNLSSISEFEERYDKVEIKSDDSPTTFQSRSPRYPVLFVSTERKDHPKRDSCKSNHSDDSTPHLFTDYSERLKGILLKYFVSDN